MLRKDGLSKTKIALEYDLSCCIIWKDDISFFPKIFFRRKMKDDISQENTRKYNIFLKCPEKMVFLKKNRAGIWSFLNYLMMLFLGRKMKDDLSQEIHGNMIFSVSICIIVTNMILPFCKKIIDDLLPKKSDWHSTTIHKIFETNSRTILDHLHRRFRILLSNEKKQKI